MPRERPHRGQIPIPPHACFGTRLALGAAIILIAAVFPGCTKFSIREKDESAGFNGGFETEKSGFPVNWYIHYPPIKNGDAEISLDTVDAVEGNQSLKFIVHRVDKVDSVSG